MKITWTTVVGFVILNVLVLILVGANISVLGLANALGLTVYLTKSKKIGWRLLMGGFIIFYGGMFFVIFKLTGGNIVSTIQASVPLVIFLVIVVGVVVFLIKRQKKNEKFKTGENTK